MLPATSYSPPTEDRPTPLSLSQRCAGSSRSNNRCDASARASTTPQPRRSFPPWNGKCCATQSPAASSEPSRHPKSGATGFTTTSADTAITFDSARQLRGASPVDQLSTIQGEPQTTFRRRMSCSPVGGKVFSSGLSSSYLFSRRVGRTGPTDQARIESLLGHSRPCGSRLEQLGGGIRSEPNS
jgi:hypothetical protein